MKKKNIKLLLAFLSIAAVWTGCKKDEDEVPVPAPIENEQEVITTMKLTFIDSSNTSNIKYAIYRDPDGDGGAIYTLFDTIKLEPNKTWYASILLLNETASPLDTISNEVLEEAVDHLFCFGFTSTDTTNISVAKTDLDNNNLPIGLQSTWKTTMIGQGKMQIELKHQPGIKTGGCALGDTDISVNFPVKIE